MMTGRRFALTFAITVLGGIGTASAAVLPIIGVYGNAHGCNTYATSNVDGDDGVYLTPDTFSSYGSGCDFNTLVSAVDGVFTVSGVCSAEGEPDTTTDTVVVTGNSVDGYVVTLEDVGSTVPMHLCPVGLPGEVHI